MHCKLLKTKGKKAIATLHAVLYDDHMQRLYLKPIRGNVQSLNWAAQFNFSSQLLANGAASRVQSEKQGLWLSLIQSNGVGRQMLEVAYGRQHTGTQVQRLTPHISKIYVNGGKGWYLVALDNHRFIGFVQPIDNKTAVDRPKGGPGDGTKETLLSEMVTKTQTRGGCLDADIQSRFAVTVSYQLNAGLSLPINQTIRRVGNSSYSHIAAV